MKTVFTSRELPHIWAHQRAPHGRSPGNLSFNGDAILSYSTEIARHIRHKGKPAVIFNATSYSVTTAKAQGMVRGAIPGDVPVFEIEGVSRGGTLADVKPGELFDHAIKQAAIAASKAAKARSHRDWHLGRQAEWLRKAGEINQFFGLRRKVDEKTVERLAKAEARAKAQEAKAAKERERQLAEKLREAAEAWRNGQPVSTYGFYKLPVMLRRVGDDLETSRGARVPIADAERTFRFALLARERGGWHRNGETHSIGGYQLDAVNQEGIVAGCHRISWKEAETFAGKMGWTTETK